MRALAALTALDAAACVPRLDDDVVGRVTEADDDQLDNVGVEEVGGAGRCALAADGRDAFGVGDLLDAAGDLRVPRPLRQVL